jgi:RHS repeat-associated protein
MVGFDGQLIDPVLRAYLLGNGYRAFSPIFMRFSSPDSHSPFGTGGINSYCYCLDDPINRTDTSGHASTKFAMLPRSINKAWRKARENGWESILTNPNIISKIQPTLPSKDVVSLAHASKKIHTAVSIESNKIANSKISIDNVLQTRDMQFEGTLPSSVSTRRNDVILHAINQTETLQDNFLRLNEAPTDLGTGRRHAIVVRPGRRRPTLSSHSSTDSIFDENGDIRGNPRN